MLFTFGEALSFSSQIMDFTEFIWVILGVTNIVRMLTKTWKDVRPKRAKA